MAVQANVMRVILMDEQNSMVGCRHVNVTFQYERDGGLDLAFIVVL